VQETVLRKLLGHAGDEGGFGISARISCVMRRIILF
jgi:hypothetical protein